MIYRRIIISVVCLTLYCALSFCASLTGYFLFWQSMLLLTPFAALAVGLSWTTPFPDFTAPLAGISEPIEDLANPSRKIMWLNGTWEFNRKKDRRRRRLEAPRPWNTIRGLEHYAGEARYRRLFRVPDDWSLGNIRLVFRGVNYRSVVSIDGRMVGSHEGGFTPFSIDITDRVPDERERELEVLVDNAFSESTVPNVAGWNNDGGILREVYLETCNPVFTDDVYVFAQPDMKGRADVALMIKIHNPELVAKDFRLEIFSPQGAIVHSHDVEGWTMQTLQHRVKIDFASLWSPESPMLYRCRVSVLEEKGDEYEVSFGIREFRVGEEGLELNGEPFRIRGVNRVEEAPELGRTQSQKLIMEDLGKIKEAGFNAVRLGAFPAHEKTLELCDQIGLVVLEELPAWFTLVQDLGDPGYQQAAETQLREMISRDRNHPCVAAWGLANNVEGDSSEIRWFIERLATLAHGLDDGLVYVATYDYNGLNCADLVDLVMLNLTGSCVEEIEREIERARPDSATILFHRGSPSYRAAGSRKPSASGTEEQQAAFYQDFFRAFDARPAISGWTLAYLTDFRDPGDFASAKPFTCQTGLLKRDRTPRMSYEVMSRLLNDGERTDIPTGRRFVPITSFSKLMAMIFILAGVVFFFRQPALFQKLAYDPEGFVLGFSRAWRIMLAITLLSAVNWAVILNRYFRNVPSRVYGSIDTSFFILISKIFRSEATLFACTYVVIILLWIFGATLVGFAVPGWDFVELLNVTAAISLPEILFAAAAFFKVRLRYVLMLYNVWKIVLAYLALGVAGAAVYIIAAPIVFAGVPLFFIETKFRVLRYLRKR